MHRLLAVAFAAVALAAEEGSVKNASARGYYGGGNDQPAVATQPIYYPVFPPPPRLDDRNVCDLDASVLLVTNHRRHGEYKAIRVRCSEIANYDEDSCNVCCQNAARRDRNLVNGAMWGFLALTEEKDKHHDDKKDHHDSHKDSPEDLERNDDELRRRKRSSDHSRERDVEWTRLKQETWKPDPQYKDVKCVCCAPKRPLPVFTFPVPYAQPQAYAQPQSYAQAAPVYNQPQSPPVYNQPQSPPVYNQPQSPPQGYAQVSVASPPASYQQPPAQSPPQVYQQQPQQAPPAAPAYQAPQQTPQPY